MSDSIFSKKKTAEPLVSFASRIFQLLNVAQVEEHDSTNYRNNVYFRGCALGLRLDIALTDDVAFEDFDYWLCLDACGPWIRDRAYLSGCGDMIARILALEGYDVCRPLTPEDWLEAKPSVKRVRYQWDPTAAFKEQVRTQVEEITVSR